MAYGTPAISTEVGTATSWVNVAGETGLVVPPADARALSDALSWLLADEQRRRALGEAAAARASAHFTSRAMLEALAEVYTETATAARPAARRERPWCTAPLRQALTTAAARGPVRVSPPPAGRAPRPPPQPRP